MGVGGAPLNGRVRAAARRALAKTESLVPRVPPFRRRRYHWGANGYEYLVRGRAP